MSLITGNLIDLGFYTLYPEMAVITWRLSDTATSTFGRIVSKKPHSVTPDVNGDWELDVIDNEFMNEERHYTISINYLDPIGGMSQLEVPDWRIWVPNGDHLFTDLVREYSSPIGTWIGTTYPDPLTAFWLNPVTGDYFRLA